MKLFLLLLLVSVDALACLKLQGKLTVDKQEVVIDQKVSHSQKYSFQVSPYIVTLSLPGEKLSNDHVINIELFEKNQAKLNNVANSKIFVKIDEEAKVTSSINNKTIFMTFKLSQI